MRRIALRVLVGSVAASALMGSAILLAGEFGEIEIRILLTTLCVSGASILAMACATPWEKGRLMPVPPAALVASIVGMGLYVVFIWAEVGGEVAWKTATSVVLLGIAGAHASLLALADPAPRHRWVRVAAYAANALVAALILVAMWGEVEREALWRVLGTVAVLLAAFTVLVPVLRRLEAPRAVPRLEARHCPACGAALATAGADSCGACDAAFLVTFRAP